MRSKYFLPLVLVFCLAISCRARLQEANLSDTDQALLDPRSPVQCVDGEPHRFMLDGGSEEYMEPLSGPPEFVSFGSRGQVIAVPASDSANYLFDVCIRGDDSVA